MPRKIARIKKANGGELLVLDLNTAELKVFKSSSEYHDNSINADTVLELGRAIQKAFSIFKEEDARAPLGFEVETLTCPESVLRETS